MYFTIKEMADQLGVTTNKLRYYESVGLLEPHINERTGYRYYSVRDTRRFNATRLYRSFGLSISECRELMSGGGHASLMDRLDSQQAIMQRQVEYQIDRLQMFLFWKPFIENILQDVDKTRPIRFPTVYRIVISEDEKLIQNEELESCFQNWLELFPICSWASRLKKEVFFESNMLASYDYGLIMPENFMQKYNLYHDTLVERIEGGTYLYTAFRKDTDDPFTMTAALKAIRPYMEQHHMHITGDGFSNCIYSTKENGQVVNYHYFMVKASPTATRPVHKK